MKALLVAALVVLFASALTYGQGRKQVSRIEQVDFANFTFTLSAPDKDCAGLERNTVPLRKGKFKESSREPGVENGVNVSLGKIVYADLTGDHINEAVVPLTCEPFAGNYSTEVALVYTLRDGAPVLIRSLVDSKTEHDYKKYYPERSTWGGFRKVEANNGKLTIYKAADGSHICPENEVRFEYAWNGKDFVLSGKPVKTRSKNC